MDLEKAIDELLSYEATKEVWRNIHNSKEFKLATKIGNAVGSPLNRSLNCGCIEDLFIVCKLLKMDKLKIELKQKVMESKYELFPNKVLSFPKLGIHLTNANLTDEIAKDYLSTYPAAVVHFKRIPDVEKEEVINVVVEVAKPTEKSNKETLRELADRLADEKGVKRPHWKASDYTLTKFVKENS